VVEQMMRDLHATYAGMKGFSYTILFTMRQFFPLFSPAFEFVRQPVEQMPWRRVRILLPKLKTLAEIEPELGAMNPDVRLETQ